VAAGLRKTSGRCAVAFRFRPDVEELRRAGLDSYARVPFLLSQHVEYLDEVNRFLRERADGVWSPQRRGRSAYGVKQAV
jgi:hypothetical protein